MIRRMPGKDRTTSTDERGAINMSKLQRETGGSGAGVEHIEEMARRLRYHIIRMVGKAGSGHPGGSLSSSDIVAALYFGGVLRVDPRNPLWSERDRFVLSKGHAAPVLYAALGWDSFRWMSFSRSGRWDRPSRATLIAGKWRGLRFLQGPWARASRSR